MKIKEIVKAKLKGCGINEVQRYTKEIGFVDEMCNKFELCPNCKATLTGMQIAIKDCKNAIKLIEEE